MQDIKLTFQFFVTRFAFLCNSKTNSEPRVLNVMLTGSWWPQRIRLFVFIFSVDCCKLSCYCTTNVTARNVNDSDIQFVDCTTPFQSAQEMMCVFVVVFSLLNYANNCLYAEMNQQVSACRQQTYVQQDNGHQLFLFVLQFAFSVVCDKCANIDLRFLNTKS